MSQSESAAPQWSLVYCNGQGHGAVSLQSWRLGNPKDMILGNTDMTSV